MIYDALQYGKQVADTAANHRKNDKSFRKCTSGEYLSGFYKEDVLKPVVTLVIHFGADEWDAPLSLHEMMGTQNEKLMHYVQDYQIHLIDPAKLTEEDLKKFTSSLREVSLCDGVHIYSTHPVSVDGFLRCSYHLLM